MKISISKLKKEPNLSRYITEDKDYTGCHPVIAEVLRQNKNILCEAYETNMLMDKEFVRIVDYIYSHVGYSFYVGIRKDFVIKEKGLYEVAIPIEKQGGGE